MSCFDAQYTEGIELLWSPSGTTASASEAPDELRPLLDLLRRRDFETLPHLAEAVRDGEGVGINGSGFRYPGDELDPGEEPFEGVEVYDPLGECFVEVEAFEALMLRYLAVIHRAASARAHPLTRRAWWGRFTAALEALQARLQG